MSGMNFHDADRSEKQPDIVERLRGRYPDVVHPHLLADAELVGRAANEIERLRDDAARLLTRCDAFAVDVVWRANWMTRAVNLLGEIRNDLEHELTESGHLIELEQLLTDEFEDGDDG